MHPIIPISTLETMSDFDLMALFDALTRILDDPETLESDRTNITISMQNIATVMAQRNLPKPSRQAQSAREAVAIQTGVSFRPRQR